MADQRSNLRLGKSPVAPSTKTQRVGLEEEQIPLVLTSKYLTMMGLGQLLSRVKLGSPNLPIDLHGSQLLMQHSHLGSAIPEPGQ